MEIILQEDYPSLGYTGDRFKVRAGFARNFLLPRGIAVEASSRNASALKQRLVQIEAKRRQQKEAAEELAKKIEQTKIVFTLKAGEGGRAFGSVSSRDVEDRLKQAGLEVNRRQIRLHEAIKAAGTYEIDMKLHADLVITKSIEVKTEESKRSAAVKAEERKAESDPSEEEEIDLADVSDEGVSGEEEAAGEQVENKEQD